MPEIERDKNMIKTWRCFHCDEVFRSPRTAQEHFGLDQLSTPACKIADHHGHLVHYIRKLEADLQQYRSEDSDVLRSIMSLECNQARALREAEESGYNKGLRDGIEQAGQE